MNWSCGDVTSATRIAEERIIEVRGEDGGPPYLVRWSDGHESSFYPTTGTVAEHILLPASGRRRSP